MPDDMGAGMSAPTDTARETTMVHTARVKCDGASDIRAGAALGHPRVWLEIDERGHVDCPYCDRRFVLDSGHH